MVSVWYRNCCNGCRHPESMPVLTPWDFLLDINRMDDKRVLVLPMHRSRCDA